MRLRYWEQYKGPVFEFVTDYDPDTGSIGAGLWVLADLQPSEPGEPVTDPRVIDVSDLLRARDPARQWPERVPTRLDRDVVSRALVAWAQGLRELAPDVLAGSWPPDATITRGAHEVPGG